MTVERKSLIELRVSDYDTSDEIVSDMLMYFNRQEDHSTVRAGINSHYSIGIKQEKDPNNSNATIETYVKQAEKLKVETGITEAISIGFAHKITDALATLTTEKGHKFSITHDTLKSEALKDAEDLIKYNRHEGAFSAAMVEADQMSVQVGSAGLLLGYTGSHIKYQPLSPASVRAYFSDEITENGKQRTADPKDIEDATVVIVRLNQVDLSTWNYVAFYGRSDQYPQGRQVRYRASSFSHQVPEVGSDAANDYVGEDGEIQNPLSVLADEHPDLELPEYPVAVIWGGTTKSSDLMPVSTSLYSDAVEFDVAASHLLSVSQDQARGTRVVDVDEKGQGQPLPRTLTGFIVANYGQEIKDFPGDASGSVDALSVLRDLMINLGASYSVPDYMIVSEDYTVDASSGIALEVKTRPLKKNRDKRVDLNAKSIKKIYDIEKALIVTHDTEIDDSLARILLESTQVWNPGQIELPENKKEAAERIKLLGEMGILDAVAQIKEYNRFATDAEAMEEYDKMRQRLNKYPPLDIWAEPVDDGGDNSDEQQ